MENTSAPDAVPAQPVSPMQPPTPALTPDQELYLNHWSFGAFSLGFIYFLASNLIKEGFMMFIPIYNIYLYIKGIGRGRRMSWEKGEWLSFDSFQRRQKLLDRLGVVALVIAVGLIGLLVSTVLFATKAPVAATNLFFEQLASEQIDAAYNSSADDLKASGDVQSFKEFLKEYPELTMVADTTFNSRSVETSASGETTATLSGWLTTTGGEKIPITVVLEKDNEVWRVAGFETE